MIEVDQDKVVVLRVVEHEEEQIRPYEEVQEQVRQGLKAQKSAALAATEGERLLGQLNAGEISLQDAAAGGEWVLTESGMVKRNDTTAAAEVVRKAFSLQSPEDGKSSFAGVALAGGGDYAVLAVSKVVDGEAATDTEDAAHKALVSRMNSQLGNAQFSVVGRYLRDQAKVEVMPQEPAAQ